MREKRNIVATGIVLVAVQAVVAVHVRMVAQVVAQEFAKVAVKAHACSHAVAHAQAVVEDIAIETFWNKITIRNEVSEFLQNNGIK